MLDLLTWFILLGKSSPRNHPKVILQNPNLMYAIYPIQVEQQQLMETFFVNTMQETCVINEGGKQGTYIVNQKHKVKICDAENNKNSIQ